MGWASAGFTDEHREHKPAEEEEADPGVGGGRWEKTQGGILNRIKRKTLCGMVFSRGGSRCPHLEPRVLKRKLFC